MAESVKKTKVCFRCVELGDKPLLGQVALARLSKLMGSVAVDARLPVVVPVPIGE